MSKHKHFHSIGTSKKMLQYARREGVGPLPRVKKSARPAEDTAAGAQPVNREELTRGG